MPRVQFSKEQRALIAKVNFSTKSYVEVKRRFRITFPQSRVPCSSTIYRIKEKFKRTGTVHNLNKDGSERPRMARTRRNINAVRQTLARNPEVSSQRNPLPNLCQSTFNRITRKDL